MSNHLQKITARAKAIRRQHPNKKWTDCIKQASREMKTGSPAKKSARKKSVHKKTVMKKATRHTAKKSSVKSASHLTSRLKEHYKGMLAEALLKKDLAKTKRDKKKLGKKVSEVRTKLRRIL